MSLFAFVIVFSAVYVVARLAVRKVMGPISSVGDLVAQLGLSGLIAVVVVVFIAQFVGGPT